ncbi:hypothetical protein BA950_02995 [Erythrobacter sp. SAORIC-644]|uniref:hypothetical protein n=1 Tax=Erythrobacter sp. SAORIC-644 TaxID=1869314 RepID=UPI000C9EE73A|nr:hypothetical protein [Erythrobacter sp. SAORIC-644]PNQ77982.1 hypothetical protein BA950_02995 [Erythrobacter sp. SAORIC-644]
MKAIATSSLFAALFFIAPPVSAQEEDGPTGGEFIMNAWSSAEDCNRSNASAVSLSAVAADPDALIGQCVTFAGYWYGRALFRNENDARSDGALVKRSLRRKRVGLYANWDLIGDPPSEPRWQRFVGKVGRCETQWPEAMMVMGFCHYAEGAILLVSEAMADAKVNGS